MSDQQGSRQARREQFTPTEATPVLSEDALVYVDAVPLLQQQAAQDPYLNGADAARRLRGGTDG